MVKCSFPFCDGEMVKCFLKPIGVEFKVGRLIEIFSCSKSWISFIVSNLLLKYSRCLLLFRSLFPSYIPQYHAPVDTSTSYSLDFRLWLWGRWQNKVCPLRWRIWPQSSRSLDFGVTMESSPKFIPSRELTLTLGSLVTLKPTNLLKLGLGPLFLSKNPLMEVLSFWALLIHWWPAGTIGLKIYCAPVCIGESEVILKIWIGGFNLAVSTAVVTSRGMEPPLPVWLTSIGFRKMRTSLHAASTTISFESTVWCASKVYRIPGKYSVISWSIGKIAPGMIFGMNQLLNNFLKFPLVV